MRILAAIFVSILLAAPAFAIDRCGGTKPVCMQVAAATTAAAATTFGKRDNCGCTGSGITFFACHCKCLEDGSGFPCRVARIQGKFQCLCQ
jgi:hypothetical protein